MNMHDLQVFMNHWTFSAMADREGLSDPVEHAEPYIDESNYNPYAGQDISDFNDDYLLSEAGWSAYE